MALEGMEYEWFGTAAHEEIVHNGAMQLRPLTGTIAGSLCGTMPQEPVSEKYTYRLLQSPVYFDNPSVRS
jgi:hypothetical protein